MRKSNVAAIARAVLSCRCARSCSALKKNGLIAIALNFDYDVRSSPTAFDEIPKLKMEVEMLDLAKHIIGTEKEIQSGGVRQRRNRCRREPNNACVSSPSQRNSC
ncbi:hypothetical protein RGR602_CH02834 [Rhizobium gallicum bv. gallicum R602sp]|uniref:Uncharacterized protein n=2 Tax=Rhizobium gallicum TaxID=56730 RepID=A0A0B4X6L6_9HYPH|nr:hypothetical protein RGR602_CH02834 [Rhizobium gallicum bv. gallicum R602sp]